MTKQNPKWAEQERKRREDPKYRAYRDEGKKDRHLQRTYDITWDDYKGMEKKQEGLCIICLEEPVASSRYGLVVDHCHRTNEVRGLLCNGCNLHLGWFENNLESCLNYLGIELVD